jgi:hypothetical protein
MKYTIALLFICSLCFAQYQCNWNVLNNGGGAMVSTNYLSGVTIGQTAIGSLTSSQYLAYLGFWYPGIVTGIMEDKGDEIIKTSPIVTKLYNAKPNPFKTQTAIRYSLSAEAKISLLIYDINGRLVNTLLNENKQPGIYSINWNGRNERGQQVSSGIYFYKLQAPNYSSTKKILLIE